MFETLIESSGPGDTRVGETAIAMALHVMLLAAAVRATQGTMVSSTGRLTDTTMVFVTRSASPSRAADPETQRDPTRAPDPLDGFVPPDIVPDEIPRVSMSAGPFDPSAVISLSRQTGILDGIVGAETRTGNEGVFMSAEVDVPAEVVAQPQPRYPTLLRSAGVSGHVDLDFIIDATGRVEPGSVRIVASTHGAFEMPAREAILAGVYRPARYQGSPVRQLVRQRVSFVAG